MAQAEKAAAFRGLIEAPTFIEGFRRAAATYSGRVALRTVNDEVALDWKALRQRVDALAGGLAKLGLGRGQTLALMLNNRPEFFVADLAAVTLGAVPFSIYQTLAPEQIEYVMADSGARIAIVEQVYVERFLSAKARLPAVEHVVVIDAAPPPGTLSLVEVESSAPGFDATAASRKTKADDILTLIYTSGTTGPPKGVQLSHRNVLTAVRGLHATAPFPVAGRFISWLPTAHIAERVLHYYLPVLLGATITTCPNPREVVSILPQVKPHFFFAVPRIWEKIKAGLEAQLASLPAKDREKMQRAFEAGAEKVRLEQAGEPVSAELAEQVARADAELFSPIRAVLGLEAAEFVGVGAAPMSYDVLLFFHALGIRLGEGWGMSETAAIGTVSPVDKVKLGTVGVPIPGVEIKIAADGEVLIRGDNIMLGYRNLREKTAATVDPEGWLATGDVGEIDAEGYLKIVDRKKELIINAAGKNMSPANIETTIKGGSPLIGHVCVIGDRRPYNTALIVLDPDYERSWAAKNGLGDKSPAELVREPKLVAAVQADIDSANARLSRVEQIKKFAIIAGDWAPGGDELTPTLKLKRKPIAEKYKDEIERMYAG